MQAKRLYEFGPFQLSTVEHLLLRDGDVVPLTPKAVDVLALLVERNGHLLERQELLSTVWADSFVEEANLTVSVSALRKALGEQPDGHQYIETVPKRGYRFVADVRVVGDEQEDLILHEQTSAQVIIEQEKETDDQSETGAEIDAYAKEQARTRAGRRVKRQAVIACATMIVTMAGAAYWWKAIKTRQAETHAQIRSIAVLPFKQLSAGEGDEILGFGMADVLITKLGSLNQVIVRPTSSVFKYTSPEQDPATAGRELRVESVLDGSIHKLGERIRVTVRLVRAQDGSLIWADTLDGRSADIFTMQDAISERLTTALGLHSADEQKKLLTKRYTNNAEAYHSYMRGRYFWNKRTADDLKKAVVCFKQAIEKDSSYALAFAGLADSYALLGDYSVAPTREVFPKMKAAAATAVEIDDQLAETHTSLAYAKRLSDWDWPGAEEEFVRAIDLNYSYATAHHWYSEYLAGMGRFDEALREAKQARELDPQSLIINTNLGWILYLARRYDEAIEELGKALDMDPSFFLARALLWQSYTQNGMYEEALAFGSAMTAESRLPEAQERDRILRKAYEEAGWKGYELKVLEMSLEQQKQNDMFACSIAGGYVIAGDYDLAFKWLQKAYENRDSQMVWLKIDPAYDALRSDSRFIDLLRRMRLEP